MQKVRGHLHSDSTPSWPTDHVARKGRGDGIHVDEETAVVDEKPPTADEDGHVPFQKSHKISYLNSPDGVYIRKRVKHPIERLVLSTTGMRVDTAGTLSSITKELLQSYLDRDAVVQS